MINTKRLLLAFVAALVVNFLYNFAVFGVALHDFHAQYPSWLKPEAELNMVRLFLTGAVNMALISLFYALFARHRAAGLMTGLLFGALLGLIAGWIPQAGNKLLFNNYPFYMAWAPAIFFEMVIVGAVNGLVYRE
ncbi:MAG: hypothetical protein M1453_11075 [Acidobacteria bacterium]|nr:hypothetical protein [Acidobacteriota bacterium]MCL5288520.1 hypothetical protein [Acidobacteriota bacterium]